MLRFRSHSHYYQIGPQLLLDRVLFPQQHRQRSLLVVVLELQMALLLGLVLGLTLEMVTDLKLVERLESMSELALDNW